MTEMNASKDKICQWRQRLYTLTMSSSFITGSAMTSPAPNSVSVEGFVFDMQVGEN